MALHPTAPRAGGATITSSTSTLRGNRVQEGGDDVRIIPGGIAGSDVEEEICPDQVNVVQTCRKTTFTFLIGRRLVKKLHFKALTFTSIHSCLTVVFVRVVVAVVIIRIVVRVGVRRVVVVVVCHIWKKLESCMHIII